MRVIETGRLVLRTWYDEDVAPFAEMNADKEVMEHFPATLSFEETMRFYDRITAGHDAFGYGLYAVELTGFSPGVEIGWRLARKHWNQGYATEAANACVDYARKHRMFKEIYSFTAVCNHRSERVMQKIGMERQGVFWHPSLPEGHRLQAHVLYKLDLWKE